MKTQISMNSPEIKQFIRKNSNLFWHIPEDRKEEISHELLIETILNFGDMNATLQLFKILGIDEVAKLFFNSIAISNRRKGNYQELTINFLRLYSKNMRTEILSNIQLELLPYIKGFQRSFYMVGGTAIALHIGHRRSIDFDLFTFSQLNKNQIKSKLSQFPFHQMPVFKISTKKSRLFTAGATTTPQKQCICRTSWIRIYPEL